MRCTECLRWGARRPWPEERKSSTWTGVKRRRKEGGRTWLVPDEFPDRSAERGAAIKLVASDGVVFDRDRDGVGLHPFCFSSLNVSPPPPLINKSVNEINSYHGIFTQFNLLSPMKKQAPSHKLLLCAKERPIMSKPVPAERIQAKYCGCRKRSPDVDGQ